MTLVAELSTLMLNLDTSCFEKRVDPDQLASKKPADQDQHCFILCLFVLIPDVPVNIFSVMLGQVFLG